MWDLSDSQIPNLASFIQLHEKNDLHVEKKEKSDLSDFN